MDAIGESSMFAADIYARALRGGEIMADDGGTPHIEICPVCHEILRWTEDELAAMPLDLPTPEYAKRAFLRSLFGHHAMNALVKTDEHREFMMQLGAEAASDLEAHVKGMQVQRGGDRN